MVKPTIISFQAIIYDRIHCACVTKVMELLEGSESLVYYLIPLLSKAFQD